MWESRKVLPGDLEGYVNSGLTDFVRKKKVLSSFRSSQHQKPPIIVLDAQPPFDDVDDIQLLSWLFAVYLHWVGYHTSTICQRFT